MGYSNGAKRPGREEVTAGLSVQTYRFVIPLFQRSKVWICLTSDDGDVAIESELSRLESAVGASQDIPDTR